MEVVLHADGWVHADGVSVRGRAFDGSDRLEASAICRRLGEALEGGRADSDSIPPALEHCVSTLEGFYAAVIDRPEGQYLIADHARSIPLWYDAAGTVVSDRGWVVRDAIDAPRARLTEREFHLTRYVTGPDTIWDGVFAVQPGELVRIDGDERRTSTYWRYWPTGPQSTGENHESAQSLSALRTALETALERLERVAGDRPIVLPLSGGYDSRLLAAALVDRGREVIAFTFGQPGHPDVAVSRAVASDLGIRLEHYPYDQERWQAWYHGEACTSYREWAFGGDALPFLAEWPAVHGLLEAGRLPRDALYCPGHTVATPSERLPQFRGETTAPPDSVVGCGVGDTEAIIEPTRDALLEYVLETHYSLWPRAAFDDIRDRVSAQLFDHDHDHDSPVDTPTQLAAAYEHWEWRGRMSTFTNGDLRVYEDAGLEWWLPLWDPAYVRGWQRVPLAARRNKGLHAALAVDTYQRIAGISRDRAARIDRTLEPHDRLLSRLRYSPEMQWIGASSAAPGDQHRSPGWEPPFLTPPAHWSLEAHPLAWGGTLTPELRADCADRSLYALRTLGETGYLDLETATSLPEEPTLEALVDDSA